MQEDCRKEPTLFTTKTPRVIWTSGEIFYAAVVFFLVLETTNREGVALVVVIQVRTLVVVVQVHVVRVAAIEPSGTPILLDNLLKT